MGKKRLLLLLVLMLLACAGVQAQDKTVSGKVTGEDGNPIFGVTIAVKGTTIGTISGENGAYSLSVPERVANDSLEFSYIGYEEQIQPMAGRTTINVVMAESNLQVDEVVVTALGISKSRKATGYSTVQLSGDELNRGQVTNPMEALAGKAAGVEISSAPGPGASLNIMIRGAASFTNNQPLYVVDGVPFTNAQASGDYKYAGLNGAVGTHSNLDNLNYQANLGSGINAINPNDIETMTVLKGAAATALYGSRAANGVILITTKSGKNTNGKMTVVYDGSVNVERIGSLPKFQDRWGQGWMSGDYANYFSRAENGNWGPAFTNQYRPWGSIYNHSQQVAKFEYLDTRLRDFYELGVGTSHSVSASGGNDLTTYYFSLSNSRNDGVNPGDYDTYNRTTISMRGSHKWGLATISSSVNYSFDKTKSVPSGQGSSVIQSLYDIPNNISIVDMEDMSNPFNGVDYFCTPYTMNPYYLLKNQASNLRRNKVFGKLQADFQIFKDLKFTYRFGGDVQFLNTESFKSIIKYNSDSPIAQISDSNERPGYLFNSRSTLYEINNDMFFTYTKQLSDKWNINAIVGYNVMETQNNSIFGEITSLDIAEFYNLRNSLADAKAGQERMKKRMLGAFANVDIDFNRMLYLTFTVRNDWSSTLPQNNNSYLYPGVTASWLFTELGDGSGFGPLTFGKLRASFGFTGKDADPLSVYNIFSKSTYINPGYDAMDDLTFPLNSVNSWNLFNWLNDEELKPEMTREFEVGLELEFFNGRLGVDGAYYSKYTKDLIEYKPLDLSTGYSQKITNLGDVSNKGYEIELHGTPVSLKDFKWHVSVNFSQNISNVEKLATGEIFLGGFSDCGIYAVVGKPMGQFKAILPKTVGDSEGVRHIVVDGKGRPVDSEESEFLNKDINEISRTGFSTTFDYKGFSLSGTLDFHYGGYFYCHTKGYLGWTGAGYETTYNDRNLFVVPGSVVETSDPSEAIIGFKSGPAEYHYAINEEPMQLSQLPDFYTNGGFEGSNGLILDRSYLKLRTVTLSYSMPKSLISKWKLQDVRFSLSAANILLWRPAENRYVDPETTTYGTNIMSKFGEYGVNPTNQMYTFGVSIKY